MTAILTDPLAMLLYGLLAHFLKALGQFRAEGKTITPIGYWRDNPYHTLLSVVGALAAYGALAQAGELSPMTAFSAGYMANSAIEVIGGRTKRALG